MKYELVAAMWPGDAVDVIGDGWVDYGFDSYSASVQLRARLPEDVLVSPPAAEAAGMLCLHLHHYLGAISVELVAHSVWKLNLARVEALAKEMRRLNRMLAKGHPDHSHVKGSTAKREIGLALRAIGVERAVQYGPQDGDRLVSIHEYIEAFAKECERRQPIADRRAA